MILDDFKVFPATGVLLGIDWGARRTGVAVSDPSRELVFVRAGIVAKELTELIDNIVRLVQETRAVGVIIGLPLRMDGTESETTTYVREFADALARHVDLPIAFVDETLSSITAQDEMGQVSRADIKRELDSNAARVILENAIAIIRRAQ